MTERSTDAPRSAARRLVLLGVVALAAVSALWWALRLRQQPRAPVMAPIRLSSVNAEVFSVDATPIVRRGPPRVLVVRLLEPVELVPHHYRFEGLDGPRTAEAWATHLGAPIVFTAGQFDEQQNHLGWLKRDGRWLFPTRKEAWMALLVSGPVAGPPWAGIIDLEQSNPAMAEHYRHVVQSMMLVDEKDRVRVRDTEKNACRVVVAQDRLGRVLILVSEGATTLGELARWLPSAGLDIVRAMNLDGGIEAQIAIDTPELKLALYGQFGTGSTVFDQGVTPVRYPLPAVIAVRPVPATPH